MPKNKGNYLCFCYSGTLTMFTFMLLFLTTQEREGRTDEGERTRTKATRESWSSKKMAKVSARGVSMLAQHELL